MQSVCIQLLDDQLQRLNWEPFGDFWDITNQRERVYYYLNGMRNNKGNSWCISMAETAVLVGTVGCENVRIQCDATDVGAAMTRYADGNVILEPAQECLSVQCSYTRDNLPNQALLSIQKRAYEDVKLRKRIFQKKPNLGNSFDDMLGERNNMEEKNKFFYVLLVGCFVGAVVVTLSARRQCRARIIAEPNSG
eukprot:gnl/MRDRNA2_/MRDRNA2_146814_c0_seq1.p1 gnl/MRDRNA2_/MRDRNA2_146814_c0~~gnl/MRDRNA2_/MRDRNA2_146814_c0_seq1.p1  ORF type:complete len:193 (+),score=17.40 gnl/MRDRNA2_/MRDRNA2_146814_c0_seq1:423-1001(+)